LNRVSVTIFSWRSRGICVGDGGFIVGRAVQSRIIIRSKGRKQCRKGLRLMRVVLLSGRLNLRTEDGLKVVDEGIF
jgi:hypothetical protein